MSSRSLSPGFFDPRNYQDGRDENDGRDDENETLEVVVPQNAMAASPNALTAIVAWWFAASPGCKCGSGGGGRGITKIYTY
jgi:hypothetical protein